MTPNESNKPNDWKFMTDITELQELLTFWSRTAREWEREKKFYREELHFTQELLGRTISQLSRTRDNLQLTNYPPRRQRND